MRHAGIRERVALATALATAIVCLAAAPGAAASQGRDSLPESLAYPGLVYDAARRVTVLFGGASPDTSWNRPPRTWEWDGAAWRARDIPGPSARASFGMAYDSRRRRIVLFGGSHRGEPLGDTWELDGEAWRRVATWGPAARANFAMAYDSARGRVVLHGGSQGFGRTVFEDTWEWDGETWMRAATSGMPANSFHRMAYDDRRRRVVSFGGRGAGGETWEWDGRAWTRASSSGPPARDHHAVAYDSRRGLVLVFGGSGQLPGGRRPATSDEVSYLQDLWAWNGERWARLAAAGIPPRGGLPGMAYDAARDRLVVVGGGGNLAPEQYAGTWEWDGERWSRARD